MKKIKKTTSLVLSILMIFSFAGVASYAGNEDLIGKTGSFDLISYNIEGLTGAANGDLFMQDSYEIAQKLNGMGYDIVAVQEEFNYDITIGETFSMFMKNYKDKYDSEGNITERHHTVHSGGIPLGDGLNTFTKLPQYNADRELWDKCTGASAEDVDGLTYKGLVAVTVEIEEGYYLDIYNIQLDEYGEEGSVEARDSQLKQLAEFIKHNSVYDKKTKTFDHAVVVTGDFNHHLFAEDTSSKMIEYLLEPCGLNDAWAVSTIGEIEEDPEDYSFYYTYANETELTTDFSWGYYDSVERVCYADGNGIDLSLEKFNYKTIIGEDGESLSGHVAATAELNYEIVEKVQDTGNNHDDLEVEGEKNFLIRFLEYIASIFTAIGKFFQSLSLRTSA